MYLYLFFCCDLKYSPCLRKKKNLNIQNTSSRLKFLCSHRNVEKIFNFKISNWLISAQLESARVSSTQLDSAQLSSTQLNSGGLSWNSAQPDLT